MTRRYSIPHTHLFRGAKLTDLDGAPMPIVTQEWVLIEFSDGVGAKGTIEPSQGGGYLLTVSSYRTQRKTRIEGKAWAVASTPAQDVLRVGARVVSSPPNDESSAL